MEDKREPTAPRADSGEPDTNSDVDDETQFSNREADLSGRVRRTATRVAGSVSSVVKQALEARDHVLMVRINDESLNRINDLKDAGLFRSRSEAAAYLIAEGIEAKRDLFDRISERIRKIQELRDELRYLAEDTGLESPGGETGRDESARD